MIVIDSICGCGRPYKIELGEGREWEKLPDGMIGVKILTADKWCGQCVPPQQAPRLVNQTHFKVNLRADNPQAVQLFKTMLESKKLEFGQSTIQHK